MEMWPSAGIARSSGRRRQNEHRYFCEGSVSDPHEVYIGPLHHENQIFFTFSSLRWFAHLQNSPSTLPHHLRHRERTPPPRQKVSHSPPPTAERTADRDTRSAPPPSPPSLLPAIHFALPENRLAPAAPPSSTPAPAFPIRQPDP